MKRAGWNGTRRNRNIGTSKQGHGTDNKLSIPRPSDTLKDFYEKVNDVEIQNAKGLADKGIIPFNKRIKVI